jgi:tetratricopeptide (TPR) repeat protein
MARLIAAGLAALALALAGPAAADAAKPPAPQVQTARETADEATVRAAEEAFQQRGFEGLAEHQGKLLDVLAHAPDAFPAMERRGDTVILRPFRTERALILSLMSAEMNPGLKTVAVYDTYPMAAFLVGSLNVQLQRPEAAIAALDKGLALQPAEPVLITEKGAALILMKRPADALALYEPWLAQDDDDADDADRARMLRAKGFALVELNRLDEAEAAYRASLQLEPGHDLANRELAYITSIRAGAAPAAVEMVTGDQAKSGER